MVRLGVLAAFLACLTGCSSLGISLYPDGHFLTDQAEEVFKNAPTGVHLPRELDATVLPSHYLQPGDVLLIEPVELDTDVRFPADQKILADGTIDLSKYGRLVVAGMTLEAAEALIEQAIVASGEQATQVNVRLLEAVHRYYVLGEVASPGSYPLTGYETVLDGILAAGGLTSDAAPCRILLSRPTPPPSCRVVLPLCYREITQLGDTTTNYQLQPGDRIFVASRSCLDELMFWRASETCDHCRGCQVPCRDPGIAAFRNPISTLFSPHQDQPLRFSDETLSPPAGGSAELPAPMDLQPLPRQPLPDVDSGLKPSADGELDFEVPIPDVSKFD
jgi:protein involved in polysaccharide export with SLBB domain